MTVRLVVASVLLLALVLGGIWVVERAPTAAGDSGSHEVWVVGPGGNILHHGSVSVRGATPVLLLEALAAQQGFTVDVERLQGFGNGCNSAYVAAIDGVGETTTGGWNYYTRAPGEGWTWRAAGAGCLGLQVGVQLEWCWVEHDVCQHHAP